VEQLEDRLALAGYTVTLATDNNPGGGGQKDNSDPTGQSGDVRYAITKAIATPGNSVLFVIPGSGFHSISLKAALPTIASNSITIDGTTQPGYVNNPIIELDGSSAGASEGLDITAGGTTVMGLIIINFQKDGIVLEGSGGDTVGTCFIGMDATGTATGSNGADGIKVNTTNNIIGGPPLTAHQSSSFIGPYIVRGGPRGNLISANGQDGIWFEGGANNNTVWGNLIGTDITGKTAYGNSNHGIEIFLCQPIGPLRKNYCLFDLWLGFKIG
jgi:hypothetical protein